MFTRQVLVFHHRQSQLGIVVIKFKTQQRVSENLLSMIKRVKESAELRPEFCEVPNYENNCYRVKKEQSFRFLEKKFSLTTKKREHIDAMF